MNLRIQTYGEQTRALSYAKSNLPRLILYVQDGVSVYDVLDKGLRDLMDVCDVVLEKFEAARDSFDRTKS